MIEAAEQRLRAREVTKIDALILDGQGLALPFYNLGFWSSRRTVVLGWDLTNLADIPLPDHVRIVETPRPDPVEIGRLVLNSYQPYWTWWKDPRKDRKWYRVELQPTDLPGFAERAEARVRAAVEAAIGSANGPGAPKQTYFIAYHDGRPVALCDAKVPGDGEDAFDWGVLVLRDFGGKGLGLGPPQPGAALATGPGANDRRPDRHVRSRRLRPHRLRGHRRQSRPDPRRVPQPGQAPLRRLTRQGTRLWRAGLECQSLRTSRES